MIKQAKVYRTPGIYKIQNMRTKDFYIGSSMNCYKRMYQHQTLLRNNKHHSPYLQHAWNKYGKDNFEYIVLEYVDTDNEVFLRKTEQRFLDSMLPKYNVSKDTISPLSTKFIPRSRSHTEKVLPQNRTNWNEIKQKISNTVKSLWNDPEYREQQLSSMNSDTARKNYSKATRDRWSSSEYREKIKNSVVSQFKTGNNKSSKLSEKIVLNIRELYDNGQSITDISKLLNLKYKNVWRVVTRSTWDFV